MYDLQDDRPTRAVTLKDKSVVMLYNIDGEVYCSDANSTAFQYPMTHAKIVSGALRNAVVLHAPNAHLLVHPDTQFTVVSGPYVGAIFAVVVAHRSQHSARLGSL